MERGEVPLSPEQVITREWEQVVLPHVAKEKHQVAEYFLDQTLAAYEQEDRYYHTLTHIADCITKLEPYRDRKDYLELFLALLWHDVVYDTHSGTNEEDSAALASEMMEVLELRGAETVSRLIIATKSHVADAEDEALICGIDLSILGSDEEAYATYQDGIYEEYAWVEPTVFKEKRKGILEDLSEGSNIFSHPDFVHLNEPATANMQKEIMQLSS